MSGDRGAGVFFLVMGVYLAWDARKAADEIAQTQWRPKSMGRNPESEAATLRLIGLAFVAIGLTTVFGRVHFRH